MAERPLVLAFDTAAGHCTAAIVAGGACITCRTDPMERGQAEHLMPMLEGMLADAGLTWRDLDAIGVGIGPGNFTGVRIAVSAARGLALSLGVPAIGVSGFEALAFGQAGPVLASIDARRGAVHVQAAGSGKAPVTLAPGAPPDAFAGLDAVGAGAETLAGATGGRALPARYPLAEAIARIAAGRLPSPQPRPAPLYVRPADAAPPSDPPPVILPG